MHYAAPSPARRPAGPDAPDTRLHGRWLLLARVGWIAVAGLAVAVFLRSLPANFARSATVCHSVCASNQLSPTGVRRLHALGLTLDVFAWYTVVVAGVFVVAYMTVALIIFWRGAADRTALVAAVAFLTFPISFSNLTTALPTAWWLPAQVVNLLGAFSMFLLFYIFPDGRFVPRWTGWLWAGSMMALSAPDVFPSALLRRIVDQDVVSIVVVSLVAVQLYRFVRVSTPVQRQQTKWVVLGFTVAALGYPITVGPHRNIPSLSPEGTLPSLIGYGATYLLFLLIPLSIALAIRRYRLWDVDVLINQALVYGLLIGLLGAVYAGLVIGLETLVGLLGGTAARNPVVLVVSTLATVALFEPLRRRIQALIDRQFYRQHYDAAKTLAAFSAALRHETDLERIHAQVLAVVRETLQPEHVALWLRQAGQPDAPPRADAPAGSAGSRAQRVITGPSR